MMVHIRRAVPHEADRLSDLAFKSKRAWGYDQSFMTAVLSELVVTDNDIRRNECYVAEQDGDMVGFYLIVGDCLESLFVSPTRMRQGIGRSLYEHATSKLRSRTLRIVSDPHAAPFYERMGALNTGLEESSLVPGRYLPVYEYSAGD